MQHVLKFIRFISVALFALLAGCASPSPSGDVAHLSGPGEICQVCRYHHDLACICVKVKDSTPRAEYEGKTYYFCSEDCRTAFLKKPQKYLPKP